jgi:hypothetical protein
MLARPLWLGVAFLVACTGIAGVTLAGVRFAGIVPSFHGVLAVILGSALSLGLSVGLFALSFYSSRSGHDQKQAPPPHSPADPAA